ncbi:hypothetical protein R5W23_002826 [Gemmata sp. JC673]|uniref:Uncharacterized protein n=1 Tax=Gemmata algarum TaxID=2975278 RepID=A0ABU5F333_9BACT|nr:hypothetical protein [Gemmata algarum]MDY3561548.1 hypothetical protein [Gemmata algarum]
MSSDSTRSDGEPDPIALIERVKRQIRQEVTAARPEPLPSAVTPPPPPASFYHLVRSRRAQEAAGRDADPTAARPAAARRGGPRGLLARLLGRVVLRLVWFVAEPQSRFNREVLAALGDCTGAADDLAARLDALTARVAALEAAARGEGEAPPADTTEGASCPAPRS